MLDEVPLLEEELELELEVLDDEVADDDEVLEALALLLGDAEVVDGDAEAELEVVAAGWAC